MEEIIAPMIASNQTHPADKDNLISSHQSIDASINTTALHQIICNNKAIQFKEWKALCDGDTNIVQEAVDMLTKDHAEITITQIGAHVGFEPNDPMASGLVNLMDNLPSMYRDRFHWTFVEPSPPNYARLVDNLKKYEDICDMSSMNVAVVSDEIGSRTSNDMAFGNNQHDIQHEMNTDPAQSAFAKAHKHCTIIVPFPSWMYLPKFILDNGVSLSYIKH